MTAIAIASAGKRKRRRLRPVRSCLILAAVVVAGGLHGASAQQSSDTSSAQARPASGSLAPMLRASGAPLTPKDRGRLERMEASRAKGMNAAQGGDPKVFRQLMKVMNAEPRKIDVKKITGNWRCRTFSLGGTLGRGGPRVGVTPFFRCRIQASDEGLMLRKLSGSMSWLGWFEPLGENRLLYYGTAIARGDRIPLYPKGDAYGHRVGVLEQVGRNRLRLEMPEPTHFASSFHDVVELVR